MDLSRLKYLLDRYNNGELTKEEWREFRAMLADDDFLPTLSEDMAATFSGLRQEKRAGQFSIAPEETAAAPVSDRRGARFGRLRKYAAWYAAAAAMIIAIGIYWLQYQPRNPALVDSGEPSPSQIHTADPAPATDRAILTLSDGSTIYLDSATTGTLAKEGLSEVRKTENGEIVYSPNSQSGDRLLYHTMTTPRGGRFSLVLPDGSHVWLNAASSITYPTAFAGDERAVNITGEVYFEVTPDRKKPFVVKTPRESITVLGTHFNVNAYADEPSVKTSLVEGKVMIENRILAPGQAFVDGRVVTTNIAQDIAWKSGVFDFDDVEFSAGLRQLARWYDLEVEYHKEVPKTRFGGKIDRDLTLSQVLKVIDGVGAHFRLEGRVLHVLP